MALAESTGEGTALIEDSFRHRMSWSASFAGAVIGTAVIFFLLTLGSGLGLALVPAKAAASSGFLTLGAIYFLAAQAMGFAVGGHIAGRLIGPMPETDREEEFRAAIHGLTVWGLCVTATALLILISAWVTAGSSVIASGMAFGQTARTDSQDSTSIMAAYWTDVLFRPPQAPMHAKAGWARYAHADTTATDATSAPDDEAAPVGPPETTVMTPVAPGKVENNQQPSSTSPPAQVDDNTAPQVITIPSESEGQAGTPAAVSNSQVRDVAADKAEVGRILQVALADNGTLSSYDQERIAQLVSQDAGVDTTEASRRVANAQSQIRQDRNRVAEAARKIARNASLWIAFALLFGAVVATMAAISARWEDDRITFGWPRRSEPS